MATLRITHDPDEWRLFIDSSKTSLKAVLLHNGNVLPSIPVGHAVHLKEKYDNMKQLLRCIKYGQNQWQLCGDLKVVVLLLGLQDGYTKYCCFLCKWDSRTRKSHYVTKVWSQQKSWEPGKKNVQHPPLVDCQKILLPPLNIKMGLMKNFLKALDKTKKQVSSTSMKNFQDLAKQKSRKGFLWDHRFANFLQMIFLIICYMEKKRRPGKLFSQ